MSRSVRKRIMGLEVEAHPIVFPASALLIILFVVLTALFPKRTLLLFDQLQSGIAEHFTWLYVISMSGFLVFAVWLCFSKFGKIRLGKDTDVPDFPRLTWFAMLFSAGMGIGMLFWGVAEPMWHYLAPPSGEGESLEAAQRAMGLTIFHWGLHPWALYAVVALSLAYFGFRRGLPLSFRSVFFPLLGNRIHGRLGDVIDVMAVLATLFGLATSLGLGAKQVNAGLHYVFGLEQGTGIQVLLIACITFMAVLSLISGLDVGIRRLSETNMGLAAFLLVFLFVAGPTVYLLNSVVDNIGSYFQRLPQNSFWTAAYEGENRSGWLSSWTVFYWGWWIAWSPFVGMFIARISRGRTIREFIAGTLLVPTAVGIIWMTGFGNSAIHQEIASDLPDGAGGKAGFEYQPTIMPVQKLDEATGQPMTADGEWLAAPAVTAVVNPANVLMRAGEKEGEYVTKDGADVSYSGGVLMNRETGAPYRPTRESTYHGAFLAEEKPLSIGDYLQEPVLNESHDTKIDQTATAMFFMLEAYPWTTLTALIGTLSVVLFFVTSSDSASLVADIIASGGSEDPTTGTRVFWGVLEGSLAAVLLVAGGLQALQTGSITIGLPFCLIVILMCVSLTRGLIRESRGDLPQEQARHAAGKASKSEVQPYFPEEKEEESPA